MGWWQDTLEPGQKLIVDKAMSDVERAPDGATVWVQGCAGTGKTLAMAHIARRLAAAQPGARIAFLTYTHALVALLKVTAIDGNVPVSVSTYDSYLRRSGGNHDDVILIDEVQDVPDFQLRELKQRCTHLIVAGDCEQRIYDKGCDESQIDRVVAFSKYRLVVLFRITQSIVAFAKKILPTTQLVRGESPEGQDDVDIAVRAFDGEQREAHWVFEEAAAFARPGYPAVILLPTHNEILRFCQLLMSELGLPAARPALSLDARRRRFADYGEVNAYLARSRVALEYLGNGIGRLTDCNARPLVYLMTYHSAKGLDFGTVFLPRLGSHAYIGPSDKGLDRALFFVGVTRARERLVITYTGNAPHPFVQLLPGFETRVVRGAPDAANDDQGIF